VLRWVPAVKNGMGLRIIRRPQPHVTDFLILSSTQNGPGAGSHHDTPRTGPDGTGLRAARPGGGARRPDQRSAPPPGLGVGLHRQPSRALLSGRDTTHVTPLRVKLSV
jgi:hypothetical protein